MAVTVKEKITKLKVHFQGLQDGVKKTRIVTINNIDEKSTNDALYNLSNAIAGVIEDDLTKVVRADDVILEQ